jgi:Ni2+-binding GTPase involved in maturation of urease and hydrogenase
MAKSDSDIFTLLQRVDFSHVTGLQRIWDIPPTDIASLHQPTRERLYQHIDQLVESPTPQPAIGVIGQRGSGKTHLLGAAHHYTRAQHSWFIFVDMTAVRNFWDTLLHSFLTSLMHRPARAPSQHHQLLHFLAEQFTRGFFSNPAKTLNRWEQADRYHLARDIEGVLGSLAKKHRQATHDYKDIVRALMLLQSEDFSISEVGDDWLKGNAITDKAFDTFGFSRLKGNPEHIVSGLVWLLNLKAPTVIAFDQLDAIVSEYSLASGDNDGEPTAEQRAARAVIQGIAGGFMGLWDMVAPHRCLIVASCLEATWEILCNTAVSSFQDRFSLLPPLGAIRHNRDAEQIIAVRLAEPFVAQKHQPPELESLFSSGFLQNAADMLPREMLKRCHQHIQRCIDEEKITALSADPSVKPPTVTLAQPTLQAMDADFARLKETRPIRDCLNEDHEDGLLAELLQLAIYCLAHEHDVPDAADIILEPPLSSNNPELHAGIRVIFPDENDRGRFLYLRALQKTNPLAYQSRLRNAMNAAGIDAELTSRRLIVVRCHDVPNGAVSEEVTVEFKERGGIFTCLTHTEINTLNALLKIRREHGAHFTSWLRQRQPVSTLPFLAEAAHWLVAALHGEAVAPVVDVTPKDYARVTGLTPESLTAHYAVTAGVGSGRTELLQNWLTQLSALSLPTIVINPEENLVSDKKSLTHWRPDEATLPTLDSLLGGKNKLTFIHTRQLPKQGARDMVMKFIDKLLDQPPSPQLNMVLIIQGMGQLLPAACQTKLATLALRKRDSGIGLILVTDSLAEVGSPLHRACASHWYGRVNAPDAIRRSQAALEGGEDISSLEHGAFYVQTAQGTEKHSIYA